MNFKRMIRHLLSTHWQLRRAFPPASLRAIEQAIRHSETCHSGQIRFAVEGALDPAALFHGQSARQRAIEVFSQLGVWDTAANNGVLIYLLLADRDVEIVADRGIDAGVGAAEWENICQRMEAALRQKNFTAAVLGGIEDVTRQLTRHFPAVEAGRNELADQPVVM